MQRKRVRDARGRAQSGRRAHRGRASNGVSHSKSLVRVGLLEIAAEARWYAPPRLDTDRETESEQVRDSQRTLKRSQRERETVRTAAKGKFDLCPSARRTLRSARGDARARAGMLAGALSECVEIVRDFGLRRGRGRSPSAATGCAHRARVARAERQALGGLSPRRPVLKHGPRSLACASLRRSRKAERKRKQSRTRNGGDFRSPRPERRRKHPKDGELHMGRLGRTKSPVEGQAVLTCKSIVRPVRRGERPIEPSDSWFLPKFPSG